MSQPEQVGLPFFVFFKHFFLFVISIYSKALLVRLTYPQPPVRYKDSGMVKKVGKLSGARQGSDMLIMEGGW